MQVVDVETLVRELSQTITDPRALDAIRQLPREAFVPADQRERAYENVALAIDCEQTISQPLVVARMLELLELAPTDRVLDVGTGSGYHAALLSRLAGEVISIERHPRLSRQAAAALRRTGIDSVTCVIGDGWAGWPQAAPYDAINVAASPGSRLPHALGQQLALGGRLVAPLGRRDQRLVRVRRTAGGLVPEWLEAVRFVPLVPDEPRRSPRRRPPTIS
jgi:protein-L-isoaspartate(D-aspartate) O-methyltransferase